MALTVDYKEGVLKDIRENPEVAREYYREDAVSLRVHFELGCSPTHEPDARMVEIGVYSTVGTSRPELPKFRGMSA